MGMVLMMVLMMMVVMVVMIVDDLLWCELLLGLLGTEFDQFARVLRYGGGCGPTAADHCAEVAFVVGGVRRGGETHGGLLAQVRLVVQMMVHAAAGVLRGHLLRGGRLLLVLFGGGESRSSRSRRVLLLHS